MVNPDQLIAALKSSNPSARCEACEELHVMPQISDEARAALQAASNDPDRLVRDAAVRALQAHESPLSLALLGAAAMALVVFLFGLFLMAHDFSDVGQCLELLLVLYTYPLLCALSGEPGWLLCGLTYLVPFIVGFSLPARMNRDLARTLALLSGIAAAVLHCMGWWLAAVVFQF